MTELVKDPEMEQQEEGDQYFIGPSDSRLLISHLYPHHPPISSSRGCTSGGSVSNRLKRRSISPSSLYSLQDPEPRFKKLSLDKDENVSFRGYSKISLPRSFGAPPSGPSQAGNPTLTHTFPPLCRSVSDPCNAIAIMNGGNSAVPQSEEGSVSKSALPPQPQSLRRTVSDPNPSPAKIFSQSPAKADKDLESMKKESSDSKRLKRIKERLREMNQWWNEVMQEQEERAERDEGLVYSSNGDTEESVGVERVEESLILRFKCPCSKVYKILLAGNSCFYKLA